MLYSDCVSHEDFGGWSAGVGGFQVSCSFRTLFHPRLCCREPACSMKGLSELLVGRWYFWAPSGSYVPYRGVS